MITRVQSSLLVCLLLAFTQVRADTLHEINSTESEVATCVQAVMHADGIHLTIGFSAAPSELGKCVATIRLKGSGASKDLHYIYDHGTVAGKLLAADLIAAFDARDAVKLLEKLAGDHTEVKVQEGCIVTRRLASDLAASKLKVLRSAI